MGRGSGITRSTWGLWIAARVDRDSTRRTVGKQQSGLLRWQHREALVLGRQCDETIAIDVSEDAIARVAELVANYFYR